MHGTRTHAHTQADTDGAYTGAKLMSFTRLRPCIMFVATASWGVLVFFLASARRLLLIAIQEKNHTQNAQCGKK